MLHAALPDSPMRRRIVMTHLGVLAVGDDGGKTG